jgi:hypothetical protein
MGGEDAPTHMHSKSCVFGGILEDLTKSKKKVILIIELNVIKIKLMYILNIWLS